MVESVPELVNSLKVRIIIMNKILIIAEHDGNEINSSTLEVFSCAKRY